MEAPKVHCRLIDWSFISSKSLQDVVYKVPMGQVSVETDIIHE